MARLFLILFFWIISVCNAMFSGQTSTAFSVSGTIVSENVNALEINLFDTEKKLLKTEITDDKGHFIFLDLKNGAYQFSINENGNQVYQADFEIKDQNVILPSIYLKEKSIETVTITKTKPYIERQDGKMILNVENSITSAGNSAFEILEKAPGINVDGNDNISLRGKSNLLIQIDGKNTPINGTDLANYLRGIAASSVEKIEFITNPSSKYDAAGTSIINIKLKKDQRKGTNGSISTAIGTGKYIKNNNSFSINHRNKKVNIFANYSFAYREFYNQLYLDRNFYEEGVFQKAYLQDNFLKMNFRNHIAKVGLDYYMNDKNILGFSVGIIRNRFDPKSDNQTLELDQTYTHFSTLQTTSDNHDNWRNFSFNINHKYTIDSLGSEWTTDLDYINYGNTSFQNFETKKYDVSGNLFPSTLSDPNPYLLTGDLGGNLNIYSLKTDLVKAFKKDWKLESGVKTSFVKADNNLQFFDTSFGNPQVDVTKTNHFIYEENINALYGNLIKNWEKFKLNIGLRVENTNVTGNQITTQQSHTKNYTQMFPSAVFSYDFAENNNLELNFSRRITRPNYRQLNPFKFYLDPTTYQAGNPDLNPQTTMNYELTYSLHNTYFATLGYSKTSDNITDVLKPIVEDGNIVVVQTNENLKSASYFGLYLIAPVKITKWWDINNSANFYFGSYTGHIADTTIKDQGNFTFNINSINSFKLGNGYSAEITGNYRSRELYAYMDLRPNWYLNIGAQKKFKNSTLKFSFNDIFLTSNPEARNVYATYVENFIVRRDTRVITLSYTYNFGSSKNGQTRKTGGADDLKQRVGNG